LTNPSHYLIDYHRHITHLRIGFPSRSCQLVPFSDHKNLKDPHINSYTCKTWPLAVRRVAGEVVDEVRPEEVEQEVAAAVEEVRITPKALRI
jgi:hypothetical protein